MAYSRSNKCAKRINGLKF